MRTARLEMRWIAFVATCFLYSCMVATSAVPQELDRDAAPFGLSWGMSSAAVRALGVDLQNTKGSDFGVSFAATNLPKMLSDAGGVYLAFGFDDRLWRVAAIGRTLDNDPSGNAVLSRYDQLSKILSEKYGQGKEEQRIDPMWSKPSEFLMGITTGRSRWYSNFETQSVFFQLGIAAPTMSSAAWRLIYENKPLRATFNAGKKTNEKGAL